MSTTGSGTMSRAGGSAWLTLTDVNARFGATPVIELTDDNADGVADAAVTTAIINSAMVEAEEALARYTIPAAGPWPPAMVDLGARIALAKMFERRRLTDEKSAAFIRRLDDDLAEIRDGTRGVGGMTLSTCYASQPERSDDEEPVFGRQSDGTSGLDGF